MNDEEREDSPVTTDPATAALLFQEMLLASGAEIDPVAME